VRGDKGDPIDDGIEGDAGERLGYRGGVFDIDGQRFCAGRRTGRVTAAVQECDLDAALDCQLRAGRADDAGATDEENFHEYVVAD
jgi:hypothetical protein